jgi:glycerol-1-phosphate dehydrogenase [NAD(P)+]
LTQDSHLTELPRKILIGSDVIAGLGDFIQQLDHNFLRVAFISGEIVRERTQASSQKSMKEAGLSEYKWFVAADATVNEAEKLAKALLYFAPDVIIGQGGGRSVDLAKMTAYNLGKSFISVPTSASHDGISSPFVSMRGSDKPYSVKAKTPIGVLADVELMSKAPRRLMMSGCGDLVGKITAVKDWELARDEVNEYYGTYAANLAYLSAKIILDEGRNFVKDNLLGLRTVVEALISAGVASCIAGSSRPCSGSEHLFSHAVEYIAGKNSGLHGERVGIGTILMAKLHGLDWERIAQTLASFGAPTRGKQINLTDDEVVQALVLAGTLRPERFTILNKEKLDKDKAASLARAVKVI